MLLAPPDPTQAGFADSAAVPPEHPERLPTENVGVDVEDGLPGIGIGVEDNPVPGLENPLDLGNLPSSGDNIGKQLRISGSKLGNVPIPLPRHDKHMNSGLRPDIPEGKGGVVLINNVGRDLPGDDPFEESLGITHTNTLSTPHKRQRASDSAQATPKPTRRARRPKAAEQKQDAF